MHYYYNLYFMYWHIIPFKAHITPEQLRRIIHHTFHVAVYISTKFRNWYKKTETQLHYYYNLLWHIILFKAHIQRTRTVETWENLSKVWQMYDSPVSSSSIFCKMNVATVFESSLPDSMIRRQSGIISVVSRKLMTSCSSVYTWNICTLATT